MKMFSKIRLVLVVVLVGLCAEAEGPKGMEVFRPGEVKVGGEMLRRMEITAERAMALDFENLFARHFRVRKENPDVWGGFAGYGMVLDGIVKAAAHGVCGEKLVEFKKKWIADLIRTQTADGDISIFAAGKGWWDDHEKAYILQALVLDHRYFGEVASLEAAVKLAGYMMGHGATAQLGLDTAFVMLAEETGDKKYLEYAKAAFAEEGDMWDYNRALVVNSVGHVYTCLQRILAQVQYGRVAGVRTEAMERSEARLWEKLLKEDYMSISGTCSGMPCAGEMWDDSQRGLGRWGETCATAYLLKLAAEVERRDGAARFGDLYERALWNAFYGAQAGDGSKMRYFVPFDECGQWYERETYCCPNNYRRMVFEVPDAVVMRATDGVVVNLYAPCEVKAEGIEMKVETAYPESGAVKIWYKDAKGAALYLRVPAWCEGATVDGKKVAAEKGWARIAGDWKAGREVKVDLPMVPRLVKGTKAQGNRVAVMCGPRVFGVSPEKLTDKRNYAADIMFLEAGRPMEYTGKGVKVTFGMNSRNLDEMGTELVPFMDEKRTRTFFPFVEKKGIAWVDALKGNEKVGVWTRELQAR